MIKNYFSQLYFWRKFVKYEDIVTERKSLEKLIYYLWNKNSFKFRMRLMLSIACLILGKVTSLYAPFYLKQSIDSLSLNLDIIVVPIALILAYGWARLASQIFSDLRDGLFAKIEHSAIKNISLDIFKHLHKLDLQFHLSRKTGGLSRSIERGTNSIERLLRFSVFIIFPACLEVIFVSMALWWFYSIHYALITIVTLTVYIMYTINITSWRLKILRNLNKIDSEANTIAIDSLLNYETVKYFTNESHEEKRYNSLLEQYKESAIKNKWGLSVLNIGQSLIISSGLVTIMVLVSQEVTQGNLSVGDFVLINAYLIQIYLPLGNLGFAYREIKLALVNMQEMFALLNVQQEISDVDEAKEIPIGQGEIKFNNVGFQYDSKNQILKDINFTIPSGQTVAIVGKSGAGKSTILRLLLRFYDMSKGYISIDGHDITQYQQKSIRNNIGIVPQDTILFNNTIKYNISYSMINATQQEIEEAAKMAQIHDFINNLPNKYNTIVGERGLKLSGGEKQRVAIARAILKKPKIFLLDEATSALDSNTEKEIHKNFQKISLQYTTIIISHRLSTVMECEKILVLDKGKLEEEGTHAALIKNNGIYAEMWKKQQKDFFLDNQS
jgi:ATP-binding cassette, subfamily B, heavy metal transporter